MNKIQGPTGTVDAILNTTSGDQLKCQTYTVYVKIECTVSQKTRPLQLISHNSINPQRSLIIFGTEIPYSILNELR